MNRSMKHLKIQARLLLAARKAGAAEITTSIDLNPTQIHAALANDDVLYPDGELLAWDLFAAQVAPTVLDSIASGGARRIQAIAGCGRCLHDP